MLIHIALLRAVNVGGRKPIIMGKLRALMAELGFVDVRTVLQTGNLVFCGSARTGADLEELLEVEAAKRLDLRTDFLVRTEKEWKRIIAHNPFPREAQRDASHLVVMFLKRAPSPQEVKALQAAITGPEIVVSDGNQTYIVYPAGIGRSGVTNTLFERKLGIRGTARNWNTILKLDGHVSEASRLVGTRV